MKEKQMKLTDNQINILRKLAESKKPLLTFELKDSPDNALWALRNMELIKPEWYSAFEYLWTITDAGRKVLKEIEISK